MLAVLLNTPLDSSDKGRSKRILPGDVGETIEATLMLLDGDTSGCGIVVVVVVGDGVFSCAAW